MSFISFNPETISNFLNAYLVVVVPVYNEEDTLESVVFDWAKVLTNMKIDYQFILINDGSKDHTIDVMKKIESSSPDKFVIVDKTNSGHGRTCRLGYDAAVLAPSVEWVLQIDSDGQCDPSYFERFWAKREHADCIFGLRVKRDDGLGRVITSTLCKWGASIFCGKNLPDPNVPYRLMKRHFLQNALKHIPASFNIHNVALTYIMRRNDEIRWDFVPIHFLQRQGGDNSINILNVVQWGVDMLLELKKLR